MAENAYKADFVPRVAPTAPIGPRASATLMGDRPAMDGNPGKFNDLDWNPRKSNSNDSFFLVC